jgi:hypothetical protein
LRPKDILSQLGNLDVGEFLAKVQEGSDYETLGLPSQGVAVKLKERGILRKIGVNKRRTLWGPGVHFSAFRASVESK